MFNYSKSTVRPWPEQLPFGTRHSYLSGVRWSEDRSVFEIEVALPGDERVHWHFAADKPMYVLVEDDERQVLSLWARRNECCQGGGGYLIVENSPLLDAVLRTESHLKIYDEFVNARHFVLGTETAVAHVICVDRPELFAGKIQ